MANVKISALSAIDAVSAADSVPITDASASNATKKATITQVIAAIPAATGGAAGTMSAADKAKLDASTAAATISTLMARDSSGNTAVNVLTAAQVTVTGSPSASTDATNKAYVDALVSGLTIKAAVKAATVANVTLSGGAPSTLDTFVLTAGDRILVKDQSAGAENGIYTVSVLGGGSNGTWVRSTDADTSGEVPTGTYVFVTGGSVNASSGWVMNTPGPITLGTTALTWSLFSQITSIPASNITGTVVGSQIADLAISTAKFAATIRPVEIVTTMPTTGNIQGRTVYLTTTDGSFAADKIYRWTSSSVTTGTTYWTAAVPAVDITGNLTNSQIADLAAAKLTGQITTTQITDSSISTAKLAAGSVVTSKIAALAVTATEISSGAITTAKLAAGAVTANELAANSVIAGKISAGAISATEIAVGAVSETRISDGAISTIKLAASSVTAAKIVAGTITADKLSVSTLSAISANIGTITAGSLTSSVSITVGSGIAATSISSSGLTIASGRILLNGYAGAPAIQVFGTSAYAGDYILINGNTGGVPPSLAAGNGGGATVLMSSGGLTVTNTLNLNGTLQSLGGGSVNLYGGHANAISITCGEDPTGGTPQGYLLLEVNGRTVKVAFEV